MATEMWWRAAALEGLQAFVVGPLRQALGTEQARLARCVAQLLQPTLESICAHPALQVRFFDGVLQDATLYFEFIL